MQQGSDVLCIDIAKAHNCRAKFCLSFKLSIWSNVLKTNLGQPEVIMNIPFFRFKLKYLQSNVGKTFVQAKLPDLLSRKILVKKKLVLMYTLVVNNWTCLKHITFLTLLLELGPQVVSWASSMCRLKSGAHRCDREHSHKQHTLLWGLPCLHFPNGYF